MRKQIVITLCLLNGKKERKRISAPPGKIFTSQGIDNILKAHCSYVENAFPGREFRLVPLRDGNYNFVEFEPEYCPIDPLAEAKVYADVLMDQGA